MDPSKDKSAIDLPLERLVARALSELEKVRYSSCLLYTSDAADE